MPRSKNLQIALAVIGGVLVFVSAIVVVTARGILDRDQFSMRLARSLDDERVAG